MIRFTIPYPAGKKAKSAFCKRYSLNAYYAGKHWSLRKKDAEELHQLTLFSMKKAKIKREILPCPVRVSFCWDDGLDIDNHAVLGKAIVDAMKGYLLQNDSPKYLKSVKHEFWNGGKILVIVEQQKAGSDLK